MDRANQRKQPNLATDAYDDITGLPSRKVLIEELTRRVAEERRYKAILSLMLVQLDDFEQISILGDVVEMKILSMLGELTRTLMRDADLVVRYAPDQFGVLMPHTSQFNARGPAERLRIQVDTCDSVKHQGAPLELTISIGLAELAPVDDAASVLARATVALEEAIELGGNCLVVFCDGEPQRINASNT